MKMDFYGITDVLRVTKSYAGPAWLFIFEVNNELL